MSYGLGGKDGVLVVDLQAMADVQVGAGTGETAVATIQPGASVGSVIQRLHAKNWGYPHALGSYGMLRQQCAVKLFKTDLFLNSWLRWIKHWLFMRISVRVYLLIFPHQADL